LITDDQTELLAVNSLIAQPTRLLAGTCTVPGDKSISHRALMVAALTVGETHVQNLLEGDDVMRTAAALRLLGAEITQHDNGSWTIAGRGVGGLHEADDVLDLGNAGTGVRLLMGVRSGLRRPAADRIRDSRALGANKIGGDARGALCAGRDHGD
jgi:5-enolpyruvylshikimate-3-phosphate synthase